MLLNPNVPRERFDRAIAIGAPHLRPVWEACRDKGCAAAMVSQGCQRFDLPMIKPVVAIICDDTDRALGPKGFHLASLRRLLAVCRAAAIVSSAPTEEAYRRVVTHAVQLRQHVAIIETRIDHEQAWFELVREVSPQAGILLVTVKPEGNA